jgi:HK97 gp10 family phage protein
MTGGVSIDVDTAALDALIARAEGTEALIEKYLVLIETAAKRYARVDTGEMRDEIHHELRGMVGEVISDTDHSAANEYGTARMAAHPFIRPAFEQYAPEFLRELQALFGG